MMNNGSDVLVSTILSLPFYFKNKMNIFGLKVGIRRFKILLHANWILHSNTY